MATAVIVDAVRTPMGRRNGNFSGWHPVDLAAQPLKALVERNDLDPAIVDDVILGSVMQVGEQALNVARNAVLGAGFPESVPATSVDRQCGSSQQATHFAAQGVIAGAYDVAIAGGIESMTRVPMGASLAEGKYGMPFGKAMVERYAETEYLPGYKGLVPQGISAEIIAERWDLSREQLDEYGLRSQQFAARARDEGRYDNEIVPVRQIRLDRESGAVVDTGELVSTDEGIRETSLEALANLKPAFKADGRVTAGNSSQITDGAAALLIMSEEKANALGLPPRARFVEFTVAGADPVLMLTAPIPATKKVLERAKLDLDRIDLVEINEAFAAVVLAWEKEVDADLDRVNVNGGAIALGHPLGASGARLATTLLNELERTGGRYGLQTMCEGGGLANAFIIERLG
ncbi:MAG: thiolase family protein [Acidimicrobiales bacterium]